MPGFCVVGVPKQKLDEIVARRVASLERRLKSPPRPGSTERRTQKVLAAIQCNPPREVISHEFSVPQFCDDFIKLAEKLDIQFMAIAQKNGRNWALLQEE